MGLQMNEGSMTSRYVCFIPPNGNEVIKLRLSDHPSSPSEWGEKEITGLPNRRYSIVIFSKKSMPIETKQGIKELDWKSYSAQNIPTYEKTFNRYYLRETFDTLKSILATIYQGGSPEDNTIPINLAENETRNNMNKKLIRLTESDLHRIVKESVNRILKESLDSHMMIDDKNRVFDTFKNLVHVMIWENGNIGGDENTLIDAENGYLQEYGERDLQMIWNNVENYTWNKVDKQNSIGNSMQQPSQL